jgi:catechol 2,3-dioxygenase-like lactoylglutathione lyase family enzyme
MPLGRFLEISLAATDVAESLAFYESLGFVQASGLVFTDATMLEAPEGTQLLLLTELPAG